MALIIGWIGVERQQLLARQTSIVNKHNPEIQELLRQKNEKSTNKIRNKHGETIHGVQKRTRRKNRKNT